MIKRRPPPCSTRVWTGRRQSCPSGLYADAGYDADWIHAAAQENWGVETVIKPAIHRRDGSLGGTYRSKMTPAISKKLSYGPPLARRTFFSGLKRVTGSALSSRLEGNLFKEAAFRL